MVNAGVKGFKCFLIHSGVDEFPSVTESDVRMAMEQMQGTDAVFLVCVIYVALVHDCIIIVAL